jgi:hypothetical protein
MDEHSLWKPLHEVLDRYGLEWADLLSRTEQIILFGSRAAGVERQDSDFDLLCVGTGRQVKRRELDVVWVEPARLRSREWLGSELAGHVARYGRWLKGEPDWVGSVWRSREALESKRERIQYRLEALAECVERLAPPYQRKYLVLLRRDLQRYECLHEGIVIPPTAHLDSAWQQVGNPEGRILELTTLASLPAAPFLRLLKLCSKESSGGSGRPGRS